LSFTLSDEQEELREVVRSFLDNNSGEAEVRRLMATEAGYDPAVWRRLTSELGLAGLAIPEEYGGAGSGWVEVGVVMEETGRSLLCAPFLATVGLAVPVLLAGDADARKDYLPSIAAGETIATVALTEASGRWDLDQVTTRAERQGDGWRLHGHQSYVLDGHVADLLLVVATTGEGLGVFAVDGGAEGVRRRLLPTMDQTRKLAAIDLDGVPGRAVLVGADTRPALEAALHRGVAALAAEQVGGAQRALELAVEYAKVRHQYDRAIGSFQAIKHMCAEMLLLVESGRSAVYAAMQAADESAADLPVLASLVKAYCSDAYSKVAGQCIQIHGGIGFTWEHPAHLYFKRAAGSAQFMGDATSHRARFADAVLA
jgi:alkylation response protein AidB-like acyl-CoA dehydrogenase